MVRGGGLTFRSDACQMYVQEPSSESFDKAQARRRGRDVVFHRLGQSKFAAEVVAKLCSKTLRCVGMIRSLVISRNDIFTDRFYCAAYLILTRIPPTLTFA